MEVLKKVAVLFSSLIHCPPTVQETRNIVHRILYKLLRNIEIFKPFYNIYMAHLHTSVVILAVVDCGRSCLVGIVNCAAQKD